MARFLVIDDDKTTRQLIAMALTGAGHSVTEAGTGRDAVMLFRHQTIDVIITDLLMPEDSLELIVELRNEFPRVPFILISGLISNSPRTRETALVLGARQTLPKPFKMTELLSAVNAVLAEERTSPPQAKP